MSDNQHSENNQTTNEQSSNNQNKNCHQDNFQAADASMANASSAGDCQSDQCAQNQSDHDKMEQEQQDVISSVQSFEDLEKIVGNGVTLVDFWAPWCGPCRMQGPIVDSLARQFAGKAKVAKIDVDQNSELAARFNVSAVPALFLFKDGKVVQEFVGVQTENTLNQALSSVV